MKSRIDRQPYQQPDLDSIEELNYISTVEEDEIIDAHIEKLRQWGYGSISHVNDLHQLFWELTRRGVICDKLFRVAVVECIEEEPLYTKFLGMAKRYNGWSQKLSNAEGRAEKETRKKLHDKEAEVKTLTASLNQAKDKIIKLEADLKKAQKPKSNGAIENELRQQIKKEYNKKLQEVKSKQKFPKQTAKALILELKNPCSRFYESFDLTREQDVDDYLMWFKRADRKVNVPTLNILIQQYGEENVPYLIAQTNAHNEEWAKTHLANSEDEENDND